MLKVFTNNELYIAHGFFEHPETYKVQLLADAYQTSDGLKLFDEWAKDNADEDIDQGDIKVFNDYLAKFFEDDELDGFAKVFENKTDAVKYIVETFESYILSWDGEKENEVNKAFEEFEREYGEGE